MSATSADVPALAGRVVVLIPAYEEEPSIGAVVRQVPARLAGVETAVVVVDDGSRDGTAERAREAGAFVVRHPVNRGGGAALRTGYRLAIDGDARAVVTLDADGQHLPEEMERLVAPVLEGRADLVLGSRRADGAGGAGSAERGPLARAAGIALFSALVSVVIGRRVTDCSNSYRAIRTATLAELELREEQFHASELLIEAATRGARTLEVPVTVVARAHGETKKPPTLRYGIGFARAVLSASLRARRRAAGGPRSGRTPREPEPSARERLRV